MFLQTGLGLARNEWDQNFGAFDPYGYQLRRVANLPWMDYQKGDWIFSSSELPRELWQHWEVVPDAQKGSHAGYFAGADCYFWGYRPPDVDVVLLGVHGTFGVGKGLGALPSPFKICVWRKGDKPCPAPKPCPTCPTPAPCPPTPDCPPCDVTPAVAPTKYGVNVGLLVAAGLTAGVGYYGYKKGWFKRRG